MTLIYLASKSPRRRELLEQIGVDFEAIDVDVDESQEKDESPSAYVRRVALAKARAGRIKAADSVPVLAADTAVVLDGRLLGKPGDRDEAVSMLTSLAGRSHEVLTAVALVHADERIMLNRSRVCLAPLSPDRIAAYCDGEEPYDKAGGYGIQGRAAALIIRLEGSYSGVMGLPLYETSILLNSLASFETRES